MTTDTIRIEPEIVPATPTDRLLTGALLVAPLIYLAADSTYAARGWDDGTAGVMQVLGAIAYGFVILRVASWLPASSKLAAIILLTGLIAIGICLAATIIPSMYAARLRPAEGFREQ